MNHSVTFPLVLKELPKLNYAKARYHKQPHSSFNKKGGSNQKLNVYMPQGNKHILWFRTLDKKNYAFLIKLDRDNNPCNITFKYISFSDELCKGTGTIVLGTYVRGEYCLEKIVQLFGNKQHCDNVIQNIEQCYFVLHNYINNVNNPLLRDSDFMNIKLPIMNYNYNPVLYATNLNYRVHEILMNDGSFICLRNITKYFSVSMNGEYSDSYSLSCIKNGKLIYHNRAFINDNKTSEMMKNAFLKNNYKTYKEIELSDDENDDENDNDKNNEKNSENYNEDDNDQSIDKVQTIVVGCVYIPNLMMWKPYVVNRPSGNNKHSNKYKSNNHNRNISTFEEIVNIENKFRQK